MANREAAQRQRNEEQDVMEAQLFHGRQLEEGRGDGSDVESESDKKEYILGLVSHPTIQIYIFKVSNIIVYELKQVNSDITRTYSDIFEHFQKMVVLVFRIQDVGVLRTESHTTIFENVRVCPSNVRVHWFKFVNDYV